MKMLWALWMRWGERTPLVRRVQVVYLLSVLLTCVLGGTLVLSSVRQGLESEARARLVEDARSHGLAVFSRLVAADQMLARFAAASARGGESPPVQTSGESPFSLIGFVHADPREDGADRSGGEPLTRELAAQAARILGATRLDSTLVVAHDKFRSFPVLVRRAQGGEQLFAIGWLRPDYLLSDAATLSPGVALCLADWRGPFRVCRSEGEEGGQRSPGEAVSPTRVGRLTVRWPLYLRARFGIADWSVEASESRTSILGPFHRLRLGTIPLTAGALLLTLFLGIVLIRRSFAPLEPLLASSRLLQAAPAAPLERSPRLLEVLAELDRKILAGGGLQAVAAGVLPRVATELRARGAAALFAAPSSEPCGLLYLAEAGRATEAISCDVSVQSIRRLVESEGPIAVANLKPAALASVLTPGLGTIRAYPVRVDRHLVGAFLLLDPPAADADIDRCGLVVSDRISVAASHLHRIQELSRATHFDALTGLAKRELLLERIGRALAPTSEARPLAVMVVGFDGVDKVNATLGHRAGDEVLRLAADRIRSVVREGETLARLSGGELVLLMPDLDEPATAAMTAERIVVLFEKPFLTDGLSYAVSVSVGIAVGPGDGLTPDGLVRNAETAMRRARSGLLGRFAFFEETMNEHARRRIWLEHGLRAALGTRELQLHFQPKVDLATAQVVGAEALLRWTHPEKGVVQPAEFIPAAEQSGLIVPIGRWVLEESCRRLFEWRRAGIHLDHIAVNLSLRQLQEESFLEQLQRLIVAGVIDGNSLELEVTESMFAEQPTHLSRALERVRRLGVRVAIDDFGTGYSSLALLQLLPFDVLKIDRGFVREIESGTGDAIVRAIIAMGRALGKDLVAEGVETQAEARALEQRGCRLAQGFLFAPALPADDFVRYFRDRQREIESEPDALRA